MHVAYVHVYLHYFVYKCICLYRQKDDSFILFQLMAHICTLRLAAAMYKYIDGSAYMRSTV